MLAEIMQQWDETHGRIRRRPGKFPPEFSSN